MKCLEHGKKALFWIARHHTPKIFKACKWQHASKFHITRTERAVTHKTLTFPFQGDYKALVCTKYCSFEKNMPLWLSKSIS